MTRDELINRLKSCKTVFEGHIKTTRIVPDLDYKPLFGMIMNQIIFIVLHHERFNDFELEDYYLSICQPALTIKDTKRSIDERKDTLTEITNLVQTKEDFLSAVYGMDKGNLHYIIPEEPSQEEPVYIDIHKSKEDTLFPRTEIKLAEGELKPPTPLEESTVLSNDFDYPVFDIELELNNLIDELRFCSIKYSTRAFRFDEEIKKLYDEVNIWASKSSAEAQRNYDNLDTRDYYAKMLHNSAYATNQMTKVLESTSEAILKERVKALKDTLVQMEKHYGQKKKTM